MIRIFSPPANKLMAGAPDWRWQDFMNRAQQIAIQLRIDNINAVALCAQDGVFFACALLACFQAKVRVLLPPNLLSENQAWVDENADFIFTDEVLQDYGLGQKLANFPTRLSLHEDSEIWLKTSGSSGRAKCIVKTAGQMWGEAEALGRMLEARFQLGTEVRVLGSVSPRHLYGLSFRIMLPCSRGWQIGRKQLDALELLAAGKGDNCLWICSPTLLQHLHFEQQADCSAPLALFSAGGLLRPELTSRFQQQFGCPVIDIYGSSETGVIAYRCGEEIWQALEDCRIGVDQRDALWVQSPWSDGLQQTEDIVQISASGFELLGRADRIIKLHDQRISLLRIEQNLLAHPWVTDCYLGLHPQRARLVAWVALRADILSVARKNIIAELKGHLRQYEESFAVPRFWRFCAQLPRNSQSKLSSEEFERLCREIPQ
ncbi:acyl-CoA synthetase (AMP-forming)/AMP-acid ligase II [Mesocricetibacter intestinalis]|uniref:Acyl-CoA synthetase (AMP-forming)/AMP-acid ligase II n=1 Tax=Mesocricetibacter intestinalis TaxID=1521930 RepID=A0A4R6VBM0_9PAST|nr:class I adenylate-forming enzyme family protein [Mesocricetibacter intestinalis]TDQ57680.1 acyl-CoA synthetase (AMP-forming)/AMP-acid ligase II [Mesocricetibacter intestinalis]